MKFKSKKKYINTKLLPAKLTFFFWSGKNGTFSSYLPVFLQDMGYTPSEVTWIFSLRTLAQFIGSILCGIVADKSKKYVAMLFILTILAISFIIPQPFVANHLSDKSDSSNISINGTYEKTSTTTNSFKPHAELFYILLALNVGALFEGGLSGEIDNFVVQYVVLHGSIRSYSKQRLFGAFGSAILSFTTGVIIDRVNLDNFSNYSFIYFFYTILMLCFLVSFYIVVRNVLMNDKSDSSDINDDVEKNEPSWGVLKRTNVILFFVMVTFEGIAYGVIIGTFFLHLKTLDASSTLMGTSLAITYVSTTIIYPLASVIIQKCGGQLNAMCISSGTYIVRFFALAYIKNPWLVLPLQCLQSVNNALFWVAAIEYTYTICTDDTANTMYGLLNGIYKGGSRVLGIIIGGIIFELYGSEHLYLYCGIFYALVTVSNIVIVLYLKSITVVEPELKQIPAEIIQNRRRRRISAMQAYSSKITDMKYFDENTNDKRRSVSLGDALSSVKTKHSRSRALTFDHIFDTKNLSSKRMSFVKPKLPTVQEAHINDGFGN